MELDPSAAIQRLEGAIYGFKDSISGRFDDLSTRITRLESASQARKEHDTQMEKIINGIFERADRETKERFRAIEIDIESIRENVRTNSSMIAASRAGRAANMAWSGLIGGAVSTLIIGLVLAYFTAKISNSAIP